MLVGDDLGVLVNNVRNSFSNRDINELLMMYGTLDNIRLEACKAEMKAIVNYFISKAEFNIPGTGLVSPPGTAGGPVTGTSITGTMS